MLLKPEGFRSISLQNVSVKLLTKVLITRLQAQIQKPVAIDKTGLMRGRSISENFVLATELVQCCHKRRVPMVVLKLDFAKAFDSVSWDSLLLILAAQGFLQLWCDWIRLCSLGSGWSGNALQHSIEADHTPLILLIERFRNSNTLYSGAFTRRSLRKKPSLKNLLTSSMSAVLVNGVLGQ